MINFSETNKRIANIKEQIEENIKSLSTYKRWFSYFNIVFIESIALLLILYLQNIKFIKQINITVCY